VSGEAGFVPVGEDVCPPSDVLWGLLMTTGVGTGTASHLGLTTMTSQHCTPRGNAITGGELTLIAANGDEVFLEYSGTSPVPDPDIPIGTVFFAELDFLIVGGSGRFQDAEGEGTMTVRVVFGGFESFVWPGISWTWDGTIAY
jgi:hypothetical protein